MRFSAEDSSSLVIPGSAHSVAGFEEWRNSDQFPSEGRIDLCSGEVLVDMSPERAETHVKLKGEIFRVLENMIRDETVGDIYGDGVTFTHAPSGLVTEPDALYFTFDSFRSGRVQGGIEQGSPLGFRGSVDWVLEVVSPSSRTKDRKKLFVGYANAGVREYWIAEATAQSVSLQIFCLGRDGYVPAKTDEGWQESEVFDKCFSLDRQLNPIGLPAYELRVREGSAD